MAKMKPPELNAYRYGTLTAAEFAPSKNYPDNPELKLTGNWEGEGDGYWYANWKAVTALCAAGMLTQLSGDGKMFQVTPGTRFCVYRKSGEGDAHDWFVVVYDAADKQITLPPTTVPFKPAAATVLVTEGPASGSPPPPPAQLSGQPSAPGTPPVQPANGEAKKEREREMVHRVDILLGAALAIAAYRHVQIAGKPLEDLDEGAVQDSAATVMIRLEHLGYDATTDRTKMYVKRLRRLEHAIDPDRCPAVPDDVKGNGKKEASPHPGRAKPKKEAQVPAAVSTIPGAESLAGDTGDDVEEDDLPF